MSEQTPDRARRLDPLALIAGLTFVAIAVTGLTDRLALTAMDLRWVGPALLVGLGALLLVTAAGPRRRGRDPIAEPASAEAPGEPGQDQAGAQPDLEEGAPPDSGDGARPDSGPGASSEPEGPADGAGR